jgi:methyl acetate hydrolase
MVAARFATAETPFRTRLDTALQQGRERYKIPAVTAAVAKADSLLYQGAFGIRDSASGQPVRNDSIFAVASMTKAITSTAAMQLVERGKLSVDDPVSKHLQEFASLQVLRGFDAAGKPQLSPARKPVTVRHLLTHTSGFAYDTWDGNLLRYYNSLNGAPRPAIAPLVREPGELWEYGTSIDWVGRVVEAVSGENLEAYFQKHILKPLGMNDTSYIMTAEKFPRQVALWQRQVVGDGLLHQNPRVPPQAPPPTSFNGGGGLYSTTADYVRFMQMFLRRKGVLSAKSIELMSTNQTGNLAAGRLKTYKPDRSAEVDFHRGFDDRFTYGFLLNPQPYPKGRSAGSLAWAGMFNTFYWIDPSRSLCAVILMQFLPFCDAAAVSMLHDFEEAIYASAF